MYCLLKLAKALIFTMFKILFHFTTNFYLSPFILPANGSTSETQLSHTLI